MLHSIQLFCKRTYSKLPNLQPIKSMVVILVTDKISRRHFGRLSSYESQNKTWISNVIYHGLFMFNNLRLEVIVVEVRGDCCWGERWLLLRLEVIVVEVRGDCCWGQRWLLLRLEVIVRFVDIGGIVYLSLFKLPFHIIILVEDFLSCITSKFCLIRPNRKRQV